MKTADYLPAAASVWRYLSVVLPLALLLHWLRPPREWVLKLFESDNVASSRLVVASAIALGTFVFGSGWSAGFVDSCFVFAGSLFLSGVAGKVGTALASRPPEPGATTNVTGKTVTMGDATKVTDTGTGPTGSGAGADSVKLPDDK